VFEGSRQAHNAGAQVRTWGSQFYIFGGHSGGGPHFSLSISAFPCRQQPTDSPYLPSPSKLLLTEGQTSEAWGPSNKSNGITDIREHLERRVEIFPHHNKHHLGRGGGWEVTSLVINKKTPMYSSKNISVWSKLLLKSTFYSHRDFVFFTGSICFLHMFRPGITDRHSRCQGPNSSCPYISVLSLPQWMISAIFVFQRCPEHFLDLLNLLISPELSAWMKKSLHS